MAKPKEEVLSESQLIARALDVLNKRFKNHHSFICASSWRECGEYGIFVHVVEYSKDFPTEFMSFEVNQKLVE
jgi:hypothetical protein